MSLETFGSAHYEHNSGETKNKSCAFRAVTMIRASCFSTPSMNPISILDYERTLEMKQKFNIPGPSTLMQIPGLPVSRP